MNYFLATVSSLSNFTRDFYIADFFDVFIIAFFLYSVVLLFKQTRSYLPLIGIGVLIIVYSIAQTFHLFLTSIALESFFSMLLIVLVVIFREELRRFFESIAAWSTRQKSEKPIVVASSGFQELVQAVANMAHQNIGALIVLTGKENIDRHVEGGKELDGLVSEELLLSIFDPTSPGHDGAVIIQKNRIVKFGAHLPLSNNFKEIGKHGTRHSAALGIAEYSDAFAIAVSEEKGTISIGYDGKLKTLKNMADLEKELARFLKEKFPEETYRAWEALIKKNGPEKILAILGAILLWLFVAYPAETIRRDFTLPVTYQNLPDELIVDNAQPKSITVTLSGRGSAAFERATPEDLAIAIDGSLLTVGSNSIVVNETMVTRPNNLDVVRVAPQRVIVDATEYAKHIVPVRVATSGRPPKGITIDSITSDPDSIMILLPKNSAAPNSITTEPLQLSLISEDLAIRLKLVIPSGVYLPRTSPAEIVIQTHIKK